MDEYPDDRWLPNYPNLKRAFIGIGLWMIGGFIANWLPEALRVPRGEGAVLGVAGLIFRIAALFQLLRALVLAISAWLRRRRELPGDPATEAPDASPDST
jgi:hypothetical protein